MKPETKNESKPPRHSRLSTPKSPLNRFYKVLRSGNISLPPAIHSRLGVWVYSSRETSSIIVHGKRKFVGAGGVRVLRMLSALYRNRDEKISPMLLRRTTKKIRTIDINNEGYKGVRRLLNLLIEHTTLDDRRRLFIWLRGRLGGRRGTDVIARYANHPNWRMRKEVARSLKRLQGWAELRCLNEKESHPVVRRVSTQAPARSFEERLDKFCESVEPIKISPPRSSLFIDKSVTFLATMPKPLEMLRRLLQGISNGVRGSRWRG